ncbi:VMAP-C domain-containing protein [Actinomadura macra]|uniref:VMAP-C domain-containing protein n=1 Tax=Actinomadura macra TaxID=46164 RepID=UPI00082DDD45|nr:trypsin-like peptidase domain-containing protein [Actinomadura macra]
MGQERGTGVGGVTGDLRWRVRVDAGRQVGAGILSDDRHVLTCAHVVRGQKKATVVIAGRTVGASVDERANWARVGDLGDVAVLRLDEPSTAPPARFASMDALGEGRPELAALGFPDQEDAGSVVRLTSSPGLGLYHEWWQIDVDGAHLETIRHGFSGAGIYRIDTGHVVGMVSDTNLRLKGNSGRMLPLSSLRRYWPELDDRLPFDWFSLPARRELRRLLAQAPSRPDPNDVLRTAFPYLAFAPDLTSHWEAICYIGEEVMVSVERESLRDEMLAHYLESLSPRLERTGRRELDTWFQKWLPDHPRPTDQPARFASVLVRIERYADEPTTLTVEALLDGEAQVEKRSTPVELDEEDIKTSVETLLPEVFRSVQDLDPIIEFALPESLLNLPCETWTFDSADETALDAFPVVVRDVSRLRPASPRRPFARRRWKALREGGKTSPVEIHCDSTYQPGEYRALLKPSDVGVLAYSRHPSKDLLGPALGAGIPVMLWSRAPCPSTGHDECGRILRQLTKNIKGLHPDDYPERVRALRDSAWHPLRRKRHQCGRELTLFWDDPARWPDPPLIGGIV